MSMTARLMEEHAQAVLNCLSSFRGRNLVPLKQFQRLLGCRRSLSPWTDLAFLRAEVPLEQVSRHTVVTTDASSTGWGATCNGQAASGLWTGPRLLWHINCLELWTVHLALPQFRPLLLGKHVLVRTDSTAAVLIYKPVGRYTITLHTAISSSGVTRSSNHCALSRQLTFPREWRLHPETIRLIWSRCGEAQVNLFASHESSHRQLYFPLTEGPLGTDALAHSWPQDLCKYAFPPVSLLAQTLCKLREDEKQVLLVAAAWPTRTCFSKQIILTTAPPWRIPLRNDLLSQGLGTCMAPASRSVKPQPVAPGWDVADLSGLPPAVVETITQARAPSTWQTYALKWSLFVNWCSSRREDPRRCTIGVVLSFLQERLEGRLSPSTLKCMWPLSRPTTMQWTDRSLGKHESHREVPEGCQEDKPLQATPCALLGPLYCPGWTSEGPL